MKRDELSVELPASVEAPMLARRAVAKWLTERRPVRDVVLLLVTELVTNSVRHAGLSADDLIRLSGDDSEARVHVEVSDPGNGFFPPERSQGEDRGSGWGLHIVGQLTDRWGVRGGGQTCVWFEIDHDTG